MKQGLDEMVEKNENCVKNKRHQREEAEELLVSLQETLTKTLEDLQN